MASMRRTITEWKEHSEKLERERLALAMLAADTPQFFNPMSAIHAKNLRDRLLSENAGALAPPPQRLASKKDVPGG
jgi:hypothetical protein